MAKYSVTVSEEEKVAMISDSEGEVEDGIVEICDDSPLPPQSLTLPPEIWAMVINCEYCILLIAIYFYI